MKRQSAKQPESDGLFTVEVVTRSPDYEGLTNIPSKSEDDNYFLCLEEVSYLDESDEEEAVQEKGPNHCVSHELQSVELKSADSSPPAQLCGCIPSMAVVISPKSPWLTSSSPQIASVFNANLSPPMRQTTPSFHHLSPPISSPVVPGLVPGLYDGPCITIPSSPCIAMPTSPGLLPMSSYDQEQEVW